MTKVKPTKIYSKQQVDELYEELRMLYGSAYNDNPNEVSAAKNILMAALNSGETNPEQLKKQIQEVRAQLDKPMYVNRLSMQVQGKFWKLNLDSGTMIRPQKYSPEEDD